MAVLLNNNLKDDYAMTQGPVEKSKQAVVVESLGYTESHDAGYEFTDGSVWFDKEGCPPLRVYTKTIANGTIVDIGTQASVVLMAYRPIVLVHEHYATSYTFMAIESAMKIVSAYEDAYFGTDTRRK